MAGNADGFVLTSTGPENYAVTVGDWYLNASGTDFGIRTSPGGSATLTITSAVPEPATTALLLGGLALVGAAARRQRAQPRH